MKFSTLSLNSKCFSVGLILALWLVSVSPAQAWWFLPEKELPTTIQPKHSTGITLSPLVQSILPSFILEPLQKTTVENPPATTKLQPSLLVVSPLAQPSVLPSAQPSTTLAQKMLLSVNAIRSQHQLSALTLNQQLSKSAQAYADQMSKQKFFSHTSPDGQTFRQRNEQAGYTNWQWMGENIGQGQQTVEEVVKDWMNSDSHRANILSPKAQELGVGFAAGRPNFWVQEFGQQFD